MNDLQERPQEGATRRRLLARFSTMCGALFAGVAARGSIALAGNYMCCNLELPDTRCPEYSYGDFYCAQPSHKKVWYCCTGGDLVGCGECTTGGTCNHPSWYCSYGWNPNVLC